MGFLGWLADSKALTPHGFCLFWEPALLWLDAMSDGATMLAYYSIPLAILWFLHRRRDVPHRWVALLFVAFIVACGSTHAMAILTLWVPAYHLEAVVKLLTACLSVVTAVVLWPLVPKLLRVPSVARMAALNEELRATIDEQIITANQLSESEQRLLVAHETLRRTNESLERRVAARTAELERLNGSLARNETRLRQVVEAAPSGMVTIDSAGAIAMVNAQTERMFGYRRDELLGQPVEMLMPPSMRGHHPGLRTAFFANPQSRPMGVGTALRALRRDGSEFQVEIGLSPVDTDQGLMVLAAVVDISDRVRLEADLRQSQKMEVIGRLAAGVSHDFNNILQVILGGVQIIMDEPSLSAQAQTFLGMTEAAARRGSYLTHHLLSYSRKQTLSPQVLDLAETIASLRLILSRTLGTGIVVTTVVPAGVGHVRADRSLLETALINLAINASDAMPDGGVLRIEVSSAADGCFGELRPGRHVVIAVIDSGTGMTPDVLDSAFDPFFTTKGTGGTGLGLAMVQGFSRQSGGDVRVMSTPGEGSRFEIWLPEVAAELEAKPVEKPPAPRPSARVLLVDDAPDVLIMMDAFLRSGGFTVRKASDGREALAALADGERFDVLVTDYIMPGVNGLALIQQARGFQPDLPALMISGFTDVSSAASDLANMALLHKPFQREALIEQVTRLVGRTVRLTTGE